MPAPSPIIRAGIGPTNPAAGVMATRPATAPDAAPTALGLLSMNQDMNNQDIMAAAAAVLVTTKALVATPSAARLLPALKPNQPNHSSAAPRTTIGTFAGPMGCSGKPTRRPIIKAETSAPAPALMCTTVPPAKSNAPRSPSQPPPQTQWAIGAYTMVTHSTMKMHSALNFILSAKAPVTSAGVMMANMAWKIMNA